MDNCHQTACAGKSGPATSNYEGNYPPLVDVENTEISVNVESPHKSNFFLRVQNIAFYFTGLFALWIAAKLRRKQFLVSIGRSTASSTTSICPIKKQYNFLSDKDIEILYQAISHQDTLWPLMRIAIAPLLSVAFCPFALKLRQTLVEFFWPPESYCAAPNVNDAISGFLVPAGLVYSIAFGFSLQAVMAKFAKNDNDLSKIVTSLHQTFAMLELLTYLPKEELHEILDEFKRSLLQWIDGLVSNCTCRFNGKLVPHHFCIAYKYCLV